MWLNSLARCSLLHRRKALKKRPIRTPFLVAKGREKKCVYISVAVGFLYMEKERPAGALWISKSRKGILAEFVSEGSETSHST